MLRSGRELRFAIRTLGPIGLERGRRAHPGCDPRGRSRRPDACPPAEHRRHRDDRHRVRGRASMWSTVCAPACSNREALICSNPRVSGRGCGARASCITVSGCASAVATTASTSVRSPAGVGSPCTDAGDRQGSDRSPPVGGPTHPVRDRRRTVARHRHRTAVGQLRPRRCRAPPSTATSSPGATDSTAFRVTASRPGAHRVRTRVPVRLAGILAGVAARQVRS